MRTKSFVGIAAAMLLAAATFIQAQEGRGNGRMTGTVVDEKGKTVDGAKVTLEYIEVNRKVETVTNSKGLWGFIGLGKGLVKLTAEKEGYTPGIYNLPEPISGANRNPDVRLVVYSPQAPSDNSPNENRDTFLRAGSLFDNRQYTEALALYREFAQKNPTMYKVGVNIANCQVELREYEPALAEYQKVLEAVSRENPDLKGNIAAAQVYTGIGNLYLRQEKFKEAEENFRRSIDILPTDPVLPFNVAEIMFAQNKIAEAEKYYMLAVQINPTWPKSYLKLAYVWLNKGDMAKAVEYLKKFCELGKDDPKLAEAQAVLESLQKK